MSSEPSKNHKSRKRIKSFTTFFYAIWWWNLSGSWWNKFWDQKNFNFLQIQLVLRFQRINHLFLDTKSSQFNGRKRQELGSVESPVIKSLSSTAESLKTLPLNEIIPRLIVAINRWKERISWKLKQFDSKTIEKWTISLINCLYWR